MHSSSLASTLSSTSTTMMTDTSECWAVAFSMMIYTFFAMAVIKSSSVIYVGSMQMLYLTREQASWPATLTVMLSQLAGPAYGMLLTHTSERFCLILGAFLCSLPMMAAALWATEVVTLCALVGVIQGFGSACSEVIPFVILMRHFKKFRGTVISAMYIVTALSGFVMPIIYENIRQTWDFRVCLFVMGIVNFGMLLGCIVINHSPDASNSKEVENSAEKAASFSEISLSPDNYLVESILLRSQRSNPGSFAAVESLRERIPLVQEKSEPVSPAKNGMLSPNFIHITISRAATIFSLASFLMVVLDYAADRQLDSVQGVFILTVFTVGDLVSRILSGSLIDLHLLPHSHLMFATFLIQGASFLLMIYSKLYVTMLVASFLIGLTGGCRNILATVMVTETTEASQLASYLGVMNFVTGVTLVAQPLLIGFVRDTLGNYEVLLLGFFLINLILFMTWLTQAICDCRKNI